MLKFLMSIPEIYIDTNLEKEILIDTLMLSNCDVLLYSDSNVSRAAILFSKKKQKNISFKQKIIHQIFL